MCWSQQDGQRVGRAYLRCSIYSFVMTVMAMSAMGIKDKIFGGSEVSWLWHLRCGGLTWRRPGQSMYLKLSNNSFQ